MQHIQNLIRTIIISSILLLMTACAEMDSHSAISRFIQSEDTYKASLRWGEWMGVFQLYRNKPGNQSNKTKIKPPSEEYLEHLETIIVTHIEVLHSGMHKDKETGDTLFLIEYRFDFSTKVKKIRHKIAWWHDDKSNIWYTATPLPKEFDLPKRRTIKLSPE